ncbi:MAG: class II fumarate hydratase [Pseudohongiella nitratireducens]|nr:class II fumarate hydratase [Pseudohongiella nitratireducens]MDF1623173.1 class II fumarate hydratase [Pseudohongiella nitratireducens]
MSTRQETDSLGVVEVPADALWGAQTQRSRENFKIGNHRFDAAFIRAFIQLKKAAAIANSKLGSLDSERRDLIAQACDQLLAGDCSGHFPLSVWQTGSGTQTNMNVNEVIANLGNELAGGVRGKYAPLHPNDHVNMSQSSNDTFPTVMHMVALQGMHEMRGSLGDIIETLLGLEKKFASVLKSGRTHMMDATPVTFAQEVSAWRSQLQFCDQQLSDTAPVVRQLAIGGSAVGTGLNTHPAWAATVVEELARITDSPFAVADNHFMLLAAHEALLTLHGHYNTLATSLFKIANDIRLMNSGPRCGLAEVKVPANEPGSSIMPGKVNPTQAEALTMVCLRVMGNNSTVSMAGSQGHFQLNVFKPLIVHTLMESQQLLADAIDSFDQHCLQGLQVNEAVMANYVARSLMLVTALSPVIGYEQAAKAAKHADQHSVSLKEAVVALSLMSADEFDEAVDPGRMTAPGKE